MTATLRSAVEVDEDLEAKYELFGEIGGGGMGRVLRARHRQLKSWVAIKLLHTDLKAPDLVARFLREARSAAHIRSAHVAHVMDAGILRGGRPYIVMEYLHGEDLSRLLARRGRLHVELAVDYILQVLDALAEAHSLQIIHRDIKPGNLFATELAGGDIAIKIVDFGLAKAGGMVDSLDPTVTERGAVLGTPSYMSPEQFTNAQDVDVRADIWGVGATLFELLSGAPPFTGTSLPQVYSAVMHGPLPTLPKLAAGFPEGLERVIARCLSRSRDDRYATVAELAEALGPFAGSSVDARIDRIRRVVTVVRTSHDSHDAVSLGPMPERPADVGPISSTFRRDRAPAPSGSSAGAPEKQRQRRKRALLGAITGVVIALLGALSRVTSGGDSPTRLELPPIVVLAQPQRTARPDGQVARDTPKVEPPTAPPAESAESSSPMANPVTRTTVRTPKRVKAKAQPAEARTKASLYEQYP